MDDYYNDIQIMEQVHLQAAIRASLEEIKEDNKTEKPTDLPKRTFTAEEIAADEQRRDRELYGPPTPPRRPRQIDAMSSKDSSATKVATATDTNDTLSIDGASEQPQMAATADDLRANPSGVVGSKHTAAKHTVDLQNAVAAAVAYHARISSCPGAKPAAFGLPPSSTSKYEQAVRGVLDVMAEYNNAGKPSHTARMAVIREALSDPSSLLSAAVRDEVQRTGGEKSRRSSRSESSASSEPGSERAGPPPHKKARQE